MSRGLAVGGAALAPVDTAAVRRHNLALVLRQIAGYGPCARTEVAAATGLVPASVTGIVADLMERGLVREVGPAATGGRGRPRRLVALVPERVVTIAVQVTLERVEVMAADLAGDVVHRRSVAHRAPFGEPEPLAAAVARGIREAADVVGERPDVHLARAVVAMAAPVVGPADTVAAAIDFGWHHTDLRGLVLAHLPGFERPVDVVNDANVAALAECQVRYAGRELPQTVAYIKADTGVGGGLLIGGRVHAGARGMAGEPGHVPLALDGPECPCGARGCLAMYVGPEPLTAAAGLAEVAGRDGVDAALAELDRRVRAGDPVAVGALESAGRTLGAAVLAVWGLTDAAEVILGGYLATWGEWLLPGVEGALAGRRALSAQLGPEIVVGVLGSEATLRGALEVGRGAVLDDPGTVPVG